MSDEPRSRFLDEIPSREAEEVIRRTATVILPVGTVEMHGTHMPLGCDGFISQAVALRLAERIDALVAPLECYSYIGATRGFPGGVSVPYTASIEFLKHVVRGLVAAGFRKVILISVHAPNDAALAIVSREIFEETHVPVAGIPGGRLFDEAVLAPDLDAGDDPLAEATLLAGALEILGKASIITPSEWADAEYVPPGPPSLLRLMRLARVGHYYTDSDTHQPSRAGVVAAKGVAVIERFVESLKSIGAELDDYEKYLRRAFGPVTP